MLKRKSSLKPSMWSLLWLGCAEPATELPASIADCADAVCREQFVLAQDDPLAQASLLKHVAAPEERIVLVKRILDQNPQQPAELCRQLPQGDARAFCERIQERPHLTEKPPAPSASATRPGGGLTNIELGGGVIGGAFDGLDPSIAGCETVTDQRACLSQNAIRHAQEGRLSEAVQACGALGEGRWRGECMFATAEAAANQGTPYAISMQVCIAARPYSQQCHSHLISGLAVQAPSATSPASAWAAYVQHAAQIKEAWQAHSPAMGTQASQRLWSESIRLSHIGQPLVGNLLDHLPQEAHPHVRAALTWQVVTRSPPNSALSDLLQATSQALSARTDTVHPPHSVRERRAMNLWVRDLWKADRFGEEDIPAGYYLGTARRPFDADPQIDLILCLIEAVARVDWTFRGALEEVPRSEVTVVKWSADRHNRLLPLPGSPPHPR